MAKDPTWAEIIPDPDNEERVAMLDHFAAQALVAEGGGIGNEHFSPPMMARRAYSIASYMMIEREKILYQAREAKDERGEYN